MPRTFQRGEQTYSVDCHQVLRGGVFMEVVFTVADITEARARDEAQALYRELPTIVGNLLRDREGFQAFVEDTEQLLTGLAKAGGAADSARLLHTLKGNTAIYGFERFAARCHALESAMEMDRGEPTAPGIEALARDWKAALGKVSVFLTGEGGSGIQIHRGEFDDLLDSLERCGDHASLLRGAR